MNNPLHFGIQAPQQHISYQRLLEIWLEADREPLIDHWKTQECFRAALVGSPPGSEPICHPE